MLKIQKKRKNGIEDGEKNILKKLEKDRIGAIGKKKPKTLKSLGKKEGNIIGNIMLNIVKREENGKEFGEIHILKNIENFLEKIVNDGR